jgi:hypothetical protein
MSRLRRQVRAAVAVMTGLGRPVALAAASASAADPLPRPSLQAGCRRRGSTASLSRSRSSATPFTPVAAFLKARPAGPSQVVPARFTGTTCCWRLI